jgi:nuclear transport factor 2 (NTF2) superfamily protein
MTETEKRPPLPPFTEQTAAQKVRMAGVWPAAATSDPRVPSGFGTDVW